MRKTLCICLVLVLCLFATGYAEEEATIDVQKLFGKTENGVYENEILGLGFNMDGWCGYNDKEAATIEQFGKVAASEEFMKELRESGAVTVLEVKAEDGSGNININVNDLGSTASIVEKIGLKTFLEMSVDTYKELYSQTAMKNIEIEYVTTSIEGEEYAGYRISCDLMGIHMYMRQMLFLRGTYVVTISMTTSKEEAMLDEILGRFYHLQDSEE